MLDLAMVNLRRLRRDRRGISALEYGVLAAIVVVAVVFAFGDPATGIINVVFNGALAKAQNIIN